jgi:mono/diheme cytochrome c family protein
MRQRFQVRFVIAFAMATFASVSSTRAASPPAIDYNRDIRPILAENCFACHGPDANKRKAGLRLDLREGATKSLKGGETAVIPGDPAHSELVARILTDDADDHMPPAETGKKLTPRQAELLRRWIAEGAVWKGLWSLEAPKRAELLEVKNQAWARNAIDRFILSRLENDGLIPSPEADRPTLIRRLSLDLTGLPPAPADVEAFLKDSSPDAYEKVVDRLLASPHYGERMALEWLDAARFADTHGYHIDSGRDMTRWRDWVIHAFNANMPFDVFTVEQLAGDLLPNSTVDQKIASGFHRNSMVNFEGGAIAEEYLTAYNIDRVNTTGAVWLGLTVGCAQCHDHKYDPISQKEFYQLYAFFNGIAEKGLDGSKGNAVPVLTMATPVQEKGIARLAGAIKDLEARMAAPNASWDEAQVKWEGEEATRLSANHVQWIAAEPREMKSAGGATLAAVEDKSIIVSGANPKMDSYTVTVLTPIVGVSGVQIEFLPDDSLKAKGPGRSDNGNMVMTEVHIAWAPITDPGTVTAVKIKEAQADFSQENFPIANAIDGKPETGWAIYPEVGKSHAATFVFEKRIESPGGAFLIVTLEFKSPFSQHTAGRFRISATSDKEPLGSPRAPINVSGILHIPSNTRSDKQKSEIRTWFRENRVAECRSMRDEGIKLKKRLAEETAKLPSTMVMQEMDKPRDTFMLIRGQYDKHGDKVTPNTPACLPAMPADVPKNRLGLARWLIDPAHPLTARVIVNRYWQMYFGTGLVKTAEDFGTQGEYPSHPELLDWLATEFIASHWDVKAMQKRIVMSATYRQVSRTTPDLIAKDPENRLLARGPRFRLQAEFVRDQALAVSGLLNDEIGGKSVSPYQPAGLWEELMSRADGANFTAQTYVQSHGPDLYRRGMYTFWKRTSPPASLTTFDAPDREVCTVRRSRTNTPLQALALMNDPTYVEAARKLAERAMTEGGATAEERIGYLYRLVLSREPRSAEVAVLKSVLDRELSGYRAHPEGAVKLLGIGESSRNDKLDQVEHAAWTMICSAILNLDETVTKN